MFRLNPTDPTNPIVFLDIQIGLEKVGRIIIELRKDVVPKTADNFRALCTGERQSAKRGKVLHYKGIQFHKIQRMFMAQGGDVVRNNGTAGESIYGSTFEDENFTLLHEAGTISMANFGRKDTNNSQFFITAVDCPHLDGTNVVVGYILRGFGVLNEMEKFASDDALPLKSMFIENCGEILNGHNWDYYDNDDTADKLPPFPIDWLEMPNDLSVNDMMTILNSIKHAGNDFYDINDFVNAGRKYKKAVRYYLFFLTKLNYSKPEKKVLDQFNLVNCLNRAAVELKLHNYAGAKQACDEVLKVDRSNPKALFRRGQAEIGLKNYDEALKDLSKAHNLSPNSQAVLDEYNRAKSYWTDYHAHQKNAYKNLLNYI